MSRSNRAITIVLLKVARVFPLGIEFDSDVGRLYDALIPKCLSNAPARFLYNFSPVCRAPTVLFVPVASSRYRPTHMESQNTPAFIWGVSYGFTQY